MRAIVNTAPGQLELKELAEPVPGRGQVCIRTVACGICATDLEMIDGWERTGFPAIPGHEWSGYVDAVGNGVDESLLGTPCVAENVLADGAEVGFERPGGYAERFLTEAAKVIALPEDMPLLLAVLIEPLAVCVRGYRRMGRSEPCRTLVLGDGPIGLLMVCLLRQHGFRNISLVGGRQQRLRLGHHLGAADTLDYHTCNGSVDELSKRLDGDSCCVVEASGSPVALEAALQAARPGATLLILGDYGSSCAGFAWNTLLHRELKLVGSNASAGAWPEAAHLAVSGELPLGQLVTHRLPVERFEEAIALAKDRTAGAVKVVLEWMTATEC